MFPAARLGDKTSHGGAVGPPPPVVAAKVATVLIEGKPAAVIGSTHVCVIPPHAALGPGNVLQPRIGRVLIGGLVAARVGDKSTCGATVVTGALTVRIGG
ncbi:PAAR domain-containing protein [Actinokineospora cianjurensis]|uniref:Putative Zn-binding protein involved in type VI secretion n=1 Tax=Actinokineospora cianjurensis TaxID=585224 RepID=A0A421BCB5_9PSEU|nr:PAAR domain-containing protein [Actinokineospora cianjurensis]RLK61960.1 putative Zn-binding protein involved in type VI secretion [Actinokineospora cianjurensis]